MTSTEAYSDPEIEDIAVYLHEQGIDANLPLSIKLDRLRGTYDVSQERISLLAAPFGGNIELLDVVDLVAEILFTNCSPDLTVTDEMYDEAYKFVNDLRYENLCENVRDNPSIYRGKIESSIRQCYERWLALLKD